MRTYLDFEKPIAELESKVAELRALAGEQHSAAIQEELSKLEAKAREALEDTYAELTPWQKTQVARHPERPHFRHYIDGLVQDFTPLAGDRLFGEDEAIIGGLGRMKGRSAVIIGHEKGSDTEGRIKHNFGMARPEGYRKAERLMEMAERFSIPVVSLVDTAGAYPGVGAEERGQAEAIARCTDRCLGLGVPIVSVIIGEGGSGGAVAIATANRVYMLQHAIYTVASPEAAASILWRDSTRAVDAATNMKITAQDLIRLGVIDGIIPEPTGGAHRDGREVVQATGEIIDQALAGFDGMPPEAIRKARREKFLAIGRKAEDLA
ncbi:MAG: acetyl-CoA carboxylase carboxyltransferase subunit alpha [Methyloceanibacter sp.]|jgi:acetyl-CoA carboxylase carboxyl transferase subunit alpha